MKREEMGMELMDDIARDFQRTQERLSELAIRDDRAKLDLDFAACTEGMDSVDIERLKNMLLLFQTDRVRLAVEKLNPMTSWTWKRLIVEHLMGKLQ